MVVLLLCLQLMLFFVLFLFFVFVLDGTIHTPYLRSRDPFIIYVQHNLCFAENGFFINTSLLLFSLLPTSHYYFLLPIYHSRLIPCMHLLFFTIFTFFTISIILTNNYDHFCRIISLIIVLIINTLTI